MIINFKKDLVKANKLFEIGLFIEAKQIYLQLYQDNPKNKEVIVKLANIAVLSNNLLEAEKLLLEVKESNPEDKEIKELLAEIYYRQDDFSKAASFYRDLGIEAKAQKLEYFSEINPYELVTDLEETSVEFVVTDPLPIVKIRINENEEVCFLIDTGGPELIIDEGYANQIEAKIFGEFTGSFAGGKQAPVKEGYVDSVTLGEFKIQNVPINILNLGNIKFREERIFGIIGTVLFYHFITSLNYPEGKLILRKKSVINKQNIQKHMSEKKPQIIPFWLAGDHFSVARGRINDSPEVLLFVDTGLAGGGFTCSKSMIELADIVLDENKAFDFRGGGGITKAIPFNIEELSLGDVKRTDIAGVYMEVLPVENMFGFYIGGIISHQFFRNFNVTFDFENMKLYLE
ncbi:MAG: aspartyl protease family protein [Candidatus Heimdallarchaeota archaeon]|nr:aspartyl protease family protein [Candidatus Heimdallarchaeota archaeon]MCK4771049.1 aspartyl protease family protein [Candidatus Heimdallarchaeota archaeon]